MLNFNTDLLCQLVGSFPHFLVQAIHTNLRFSIATMAPPLDELGPTRLSLRAY